MPSALKIFMLAMISGRKEISLAEVDAKAAPTARTR